MKRLSHVFLHCFDLARQLAFYRDVLALPVAFEEPGVCAFLDLGGPRLALYPGREATRNPTFLVLDLADEAALVAEHARLKSHAPSTIRAVPYGRAFDLLDPEGNSVELHIATR